MYIPAHYNEESWEPKKHLIETYPLATVVTTQDGKLVANHFPFYLHEDPETGKKVLQAHIAKKNGQVPSLRDNDHVLVIFQSPDSYISPTYYPEKQRTHKFVPTWDFASLHIYGKSKLIDDFAFVRRQLENFSHQNEKSRPVPWKVSDAPEKYTNLMQKAIIGLEIEICETECKYKFEQKYSHENVTGVVEGLAADGKHAVLEYVKQANGV